MLLLYPRIPFVACMIQLMLSHVFSCATHLLMLISRLRRIHAPDSAASTAPHRLRRVRERGGKIPEARNPMYSSRYERLMYFLKGQKIRCFFLLLPYTVYYSIYYMYIYIYIQMFPYNFDKHRCSTSEKHVLHDATQ